MHQFSSGKALEAVIKESNEENVMEQVSV